MNNHDSFRLQNSFCKRFPKTTFVNILSVPTYQNQNDFFQRKSHFSLRREESKEWMGRQSPHAKSTYYGSLVCLIH